MSFDSQVFVRVEVEHFLPIELFRLQTIPINLVL